MDSESMVTVIVTWGECKIVISFLFASGKESPNLIDFSGIEQYGTKKGAICVSIPQKCGICNGSLIIIELLYQRRERCKR